MPSEKISVPSGIPESMTAGTLVTERTIVEEDRVRKRTAIGLAPRRPTARPTVQQPPKDLFSATQRWLIALLLFGLLISTGLLIMAKSAGAPTAWSDLGTYGNALFQGETWPNRVSNYSPGTNYQLRFTDEFDRLTGIIASTQQAGEWMTEVEPLQGTFHMRLWPGRLVWSTIAFVDPITQEVPPYHIAASFTIVDLMPNGYTGLIGRYQDPTNFYLFLIDGLARYQIQLWQNGRLTTLQPWTQSALLNPAGFENIIALEDNGTALQFLANGGALATVSTPILPKGEAGIVGGAAAQSMAEIRVDWLQIYRFMN